MKKQLILKKGLAGILLIVPVLVFLFSGTAHADRWAKAYGGVLSDQAYSVQQTSDGGFIVAGVTDSSGSSDAWFLKLDADGEVEWEKTYGGDGNYVARSVQQTSDGGYIVAGETDSSGSPDVWFLKLNPNGTLSGQSTYGGNLDDRAYSIQQTSDGGFIVAGETNSSGAGGSDFWVLKLNKNGNVGPTFLGTWQKTYGTESDNRARSVQQTSDGGYIVAGYTESSEGNGDAWVLKLTSKGIVNWEKSYGGVDYDEAFSVQQTSDSGYIVAGIYGDGDAWVLKLNSSGTVDWENKYGTNLYEYARSVQQTSDGGYIVAGFTESFGTVGGDAWVLKLYSDGTVARQKTYGGADYDDASSVRQIADGGYIVAGKTSSFGAGESDFFVLKLNKDVEIPDCDAMATSSATPVSTSPTITETDAVVLPTTVNNKKGLALSAGLEEVVDEVCSYEEPDLVVSSLDAPVSASKDATINITDTTENIGGVGAGASTTKFYFSSDNVLDVGTDPLLGSRSVPALGAGDSDADTTSVTIPAVDAGNYYIIAKADADDPEDVIESLENNNITVKAITLVEVTLLTPNGGEVIPSGGVWGVCWKAPVIAKKFTLEYTTDNTAEPIIWTPIKTVTGLNCITWDVPVVAANKKQCRVRVTGYDSADVEVGRDKSDKSFTIEVIKVTSPNGGETLNAGTTWYIRWLTNRTTAPVTQTVLEYNNGTLWKPIETLSGNPGLFKWTVPNENSANCKVRVTLKAGGTKIGTDVSNKVFKILPLP